MKVVLPIAGRGSRFLNVGVRTPKPLIPVLGKPMVQRAIESIPFVKPSDLIFVVREDHQKEYEIADTLNNLFGNQITIVYTNGVTEGATCTVLLAREHIDTGEDLLIMDTDHYFVSDIEEEIKNINPDVKGIILVFEDDNPKWSFTKVDQDGYVVEIAEKKPISKYANVGAYYFTRGTDFVWAAEKMIEKNLRVNNEFYVAPVYNQLIERGDKITILISREMWEMGTPEDLKYFEENFKVD